MSRRTASGSKIVVIPDDAVVIRTAEVKAMVEEQGVRETARELGFTPAYVSRIAKGTRGGPLAGRGP